MLSQQGTIRDQRRYCVPDSPPQMGTCPLIIGIGHGIRHGILLCPPLLPPTLVHSMRYARSQPSPPSYCHQCQSRFPMALSLPPMPIPSPRHPLILLFPCTFGLLPHGLSPS